MKEVSVGDADVGIVRSLTMGLVRWSFIESIPPENIVVDTGDAIAAGGVINLHMLAICPVTKATWSVVRCHDANGSLKPVIFFMAYYQIDNY